MFEQTIWQSMWYSEGIQKSSFVCKCTALNMRLNRSCVCIINGLYRYTLCSEQRDVESKWLSCPWEIGRSHEIMHYWEAIAEVLRRLKAGNLQRQQSQTLINWFLWMSYIQLTSWILLLFTVLHSAEPGCQDRAFQTKGPQSYYL